jgi:molecular chaperone GrpE
MNHTTETKETETNHLDIPISETAAEPATEAAATVDPIAELQQRIERLTADLAQERDKRLRALADYDNYRKRSQSDWQRMIAIAGERIIKQLLPVLDDLERTLQQTNGPAESNAVRTAMEMSLRKLSASLQAEGLAVIEALGQPFDPRWHEAVSEVNDPAQPDGVVTREVEKGYQLGGKVLRHSRVIVNRRVAEIASEENG